MSDQTEIPSPTRQAELTEPVLSAVLSHADRRSLFGLYGKAAKIVVAALAADEIAGACAWFRVAARIRRRLDELASFGFGLELEFPLQPRTVTVEPRLVYHGTFEPEFASPAFAVKIEPVE